MTILMNVLHAEKRTVDFHIQEGFECLLDVLGYAKSSAVVLVGTFIMCSNFCHTIYYTTMLNVKPELA